MNAVQILLEDHRQVKKLFAEFKKNGPGGQKRKQNIAAKVIEELKAHSQLEEQLFYPAVRAKAGKKTGDLILEGIEEHRVADYLMERIQATRPEDETFDAKFKVLTESVKDHMKEEEGQLFPTARKVLANELGPLGARMQALEEKLEA